MGEKYFYIKDITGTIYGIVDESGTLVGKYSYSAYGKCTVLVDTDGIAKANPFRFKCYYYDTESGMYYCQTRYFVPEWGRWLNADHASFLQFDNINGMNLFAYCNNSPVMYADPTGKLLLASIFIGAFIGGIFGAIEGGISAKIAGRDVGWGIFLGAIGGAICGGLSGGLGATSVSLLKSVTTIGFVSYYTGAATEFFNQLVNQEQIDGKNIILAGIKSSISNMTSFVFANYIGSYLDDAYDIFGQSFGTSIIFSGFNFMLNGFEMIISPDDGIDRKKRIIENY